MSVTSAKVPGTGTSTGNFSWSASTGTLVSAVATDDGATSYIIGGSDIDGIPPDSANSAPVDYTNFGFTSSDVPSGATIDGVTVTLVRRNPGFATNFIKDLVVQLMLSGATIGSSQADTVTQWPVSFTTKTYGSSSSTWGAALTQGNVVDSTFGVRISVTTNNHSDIGSADAVAQVTLVSMTINYTSTGVAGRVSRGFNLFFMDRTQG